MSDLDTRVAALQKSGADFSATLQTLSRLRPVAKLDPQVNAQTLKLLTDGASLKAAVRSATQMIEAGKRWTEKTFQTDAMETIPFAPQIVSATAASATAAIAHYMDAAKPVLARLSELEKKFTGMSDDEKAGLAALPSPAVPAMNVKAAFVLLAVLGTAIWWINGDEL